MENIPYFLEQVFAEAIEAVDQFPIDVVGVAKGVISLIEESCVVEVASFKVNQRTEYLSWRCESHRGQVEWEASHGKVDSELEDSSLVRALVNEKHPVPAFGHLLLMIFQG